MRIVQFRSILVLSLVYLGLVALLYSFMRKTHALDLLFETPGRQGPQINNDIVQFNFKRYSKHLLQPELERSLGGEVGYKWNNTPLTAEGSATGESRGGHVSADAVTLQLLQVNEINHTVVKYSPPNYCLHAFYYMWYGNVERDGSYFHWNHKYIKHWDPKIAKQYRDGRHSPPDDIGASFYPALGSYSSRDPAVIESHMQQLRQAGVGVVAVSWYPPNLADEEGLPPDSLLSLLLDVAMKYDIRVTVHLEPYHNRTPASVHDDLKYISEHYYRHPAFYKIKSSAKEGKFPMVYIYDSYLSPANEWAEVLTPKGKLTIRGTSHDCIAIALLVEESHKKFILGGGFDGFYTYFASNKFSFGSTITRWKSLAEFASKYNILFIPSVGPGYEDTRVRPWNQRNSRQREDGAYYRQMFNSALNSAQAQVVSITSFNEWHEGTQIELAVPKAIPTFKYLDYLPHPPEYYLELTKEFSEQLNCTGSL